MILEQDEETITFGFDFLKTTIGLDDFDRVLFESEDAEFYTEYRIMVNQKDKEEIHSYFEKHYMDIAEFPSYSCCLKELILDFINIPDDYEIKSYKAIPGGKTASLRINTKNGAVYLLKDILIQYGDTFKDSIYTIYKNVKEYYNRDENKKRKQSFMKVFMKEYDQSNNK